MRDLALTTDPSQPRDLAVTSGRAALTSGPAAVGQRLFLRLSLWQGEFVLDTDAGIPALGTVLAKGRVAVAEALLRRAVVTCPGVAALRSGRLDLDRRTRRAVYLFDARTAEGEPASLAAFTAGAS